MEEEKPVDFYRSKDIMGLEKPPPLKGGTTNQKQPVYDSEELPDLLTRIKAVFVDVISILLIFSLTSWVVSNFGDPPGWIRGFILIFMFYLYEPTLISFMGGTIGHQIMDIKVAHYRYPKEKINFVRASLRFITKYFLGWLSFITISFHNHKRAIHDMIGNSIVLYKGPGTH